MLAKGLFGSQRRGCIQPNLSTFAGSTTLPAMLIATAAEDSAKGDLELELLQHLAAIGPRKGTDREIRHEGVHVAYWFKQIWASEN